jgi:hypothetical protein
MEPSVRNGSLPVAKRATAETEKTSQIPWGPVATHCRRQRACGCLPLVAKGTSPTEEVDLRAPQNAATLTCAFQAVKRRLLRCQAARYRQDCSRSLCSPRDPLAHNHDGFAFTHRH